MLFRVRILGGLRDHILTILDLLWGVFGRQFWSILGYRFWIDFRRVSPKVKAGLELEVIWGVAGVQKQVYINKISRSTDGNQLTCNQQIS